jgi:DNA repair exonuclease SbcCD nuclease subunit
MIKFSKIDESASLFDNRQKTFTEILTCLVDEVLTVKIEGKDASISENVQITIDGKENLVKLIEKLVEVNSAKTSKKVLEHVKYRSAIELDLNWINREVDKLNKIIEG